jgi:hypothetical protein
VEDGLSNMLLDVDMFLDIDKHACCWIWTQSCAYKGFGLTKTTRESENYDSVVHSKDMCALHPPGGPKSGKSPFTSSQNGS